MFNGFDSATHLAALVTQHSLLRLVFELRRCRPEQWWCYSATTKSAGFAHVNGATVALCISLGVFVWRNWRFIKVLKVQNLVESRTQFDILTNRT